MPKWYVYLDNGQLKAELGELPSVAFIEFSISGFNCLNRWLHYNGTPSNLVGFVITQAATITSIRAEVTTAATCTFYVRTRGPIVQTAAGDDLVNRNGDTIIDAPGYQDIHSLALSSESAKEDTGLSIPLAALDEIMVYQEGGNTNQPKVTLTLSI